MLLNRPHRPRRVVPPMKKVGITPVSKRLRDPVLFHGFQPVSEFGMDTSKVLMNVVREVSLRAQLALIGPSLLRRPENRVVALKWKIGESLCLGPRHLLRQSQKRALGRELGWCLKSRSALL